MLNTEDIINLIMKDDWMMEILRSAKTLNLPDWWVGAGFIRSKVWDTLHNYSTRTPIPDIDVIYLRLTNDSIEKIILEEKHFENILNNLHPEINWSVKNQARMHTLHNDNPYKSSEEALGQWIETATCIGTRINNNNQFVLVAPRGIDDLVNLVLRPINNTHTVKTLFHKRIKNKNWLKKWPRLRIIED